MFHIFSLRHLFCLLDPILAYPSPLLTSSHHQAQRCYCLHFISGSGSIGNLNRFGESQRLIPKNHFTLVVTVSKQTLRTIASNLVDFGFCRRGTTFYAGFHISFPPQALVLVFLHHETQCDSRNHPQGQASSARCA
jgi:hypothetical protein